MIITGMVQEKPEAQEKFPSMADRLSILLYDIEIKRAILARDDTPIPGIAYCRGWSDHLGMGIAVVCAYDYLDATYRVFDDQHLDDLARLIEAREIIAGFNTIGFDNKVLSAHGIPIPAQKNYDMLVEIKKNAPAASFGNGRSGLKLDDCCRANFGTEKNGSGADAPLLYQRGEWEKLVKYCLHDVRLSKMLLDRIIEKGEILDPRFEGKVIKVAKPPVSFDSLLRSDDQMRVTNRS